MGNTYGFKLEDILDISPEINQCEEIFLKFVKINKFKTNNELSFLRALKIFLHRNEPSVRLKTEGSIIRNYDCLSMAVIACCIASRSGYDVKIARPDIISRYFHSVLVTSNNKMFKLTGKRKDYGFKIMTHDTIRKRLMFTDSVFNLF